MADIAHRGRKFKIEGVSENDHILKEIHRRGTFYEIDLLTYIESIREAFSSGITVDVGANIGNHAIFLSEFVRNPVLAFEPNPAVLPILKANLTHNGVDARVVELGLGATPSRGSMEVVDDANIGTARITAGDDIEISTLDEQCRDLEVAVIKVDVEGMELQVLLGAVDTLKRCRPHLFLEAATRGRFRELRQFLEPLGYRPIVHWAYTPVWHFAYNPSPELIARAKRRRRWRAFKH